MDDHQYRLGWVVRILVVQTVVVGILFFAMVASRVQGCERAKADRLDNASGWRIAQHRAISQGQVGFADRYDTLATHLEHRSELNCIRSAVIP
jgi:hypothetical protein